MRQNLNKNVIWKPHKGAQEKFLSCPTDEAIAHGNRGGGKGLLPDEKVLTPTGWTTIGKLKKGSVILNPDGTKQTVLKVFHRKKQQIYKIYFSDTTIKCDKDHLWFTNIGPVTNSCLGFDGSIIRTEDIFKILSRNPYKNIEIPCTCPVEFDNGFASYEAGVSLGSEPIPEKYLYSNASSRLALLQGILDIDEEVSDPIYFSSESEEYIRDICFLVHSLGGIAKVTPGYTVCIQLPSKKRLTRKIVRIKKLKKKQKTICILVDNPNRLFLTKDFLVTHNTDVLLMDFLRGVGVGHGSEWRGILFREEYTQLTDVINKSRKWISQIFPDAKYNGSEHKWTFKTGEVLYLRYMRVPEDYWNYHGHEYSIKANSSIQLGNNDLVKASDVQVGDFLQTLEGPKKVTKVLKYTKPGVKVSVLDEDSCLVGTQLQGIMHPVLTNDGWQRIGMSCLCQTSQQLSFESPLVKEVFRFLHGMHQEILQLSSLSRTYYPHHSLFAILRMHQVQFSVLRQIWQQSVLMTYQNPSISQFFPEIDLSILLAYVFDEIHLETFYEVMTPRHSVVSLLLGYCAFLLTSLRQQHLTALYSLGSTLFHSFSGSSSQEIQKYQVQMQLPSEMCNYLVRTYGSPQLVCYPYVVNDIYQDVLLAKHIGLGSLGDYFPYRHQDDALFLRLLTSFQAEVPLHGHVPSHHCNMDTSLENVQYETPYSAGTLSNTSLQPLHSSSCTFSVSPLETPIEMVDFEVQGAHHYISMLNSGNTINAPQRQPILQNNFIVNQNCWIGWEELTNWATDECYKSMMSCNRSSNPDIPLRIRATCNPSGIGHGWVRSYFIDVADPYKVYMDPETNRSRVHIPLMLDENKTLLEADPNYVNTILAAAQDDPVKYKAWVLGEWDIVAGGFFTDLWDKNIHVLPHIRIPSTWSIYRSFDWGSTKPWSVSYLAESNGEQPDIYDYPDGFQIPYFTKGSVIVIREIYGWNGTVNTGDQATSQQIAERVLDMDAAILREFGCRVFPGPADINIFEVRDGTSIAATMRSFGLHWTKAYKGRGSRISGWSLMRTMLGAAKRRDLENPGLYYSEKAVHHIRTIQIMQHDPKNPEDIDSDLEDHCCDGTRYGLTRKLNRMTRRKVGAL